MTKTKNQVNNNMSNETKVMCPVCGTEFAIGEHEHTVKNALAVGKDSGLGEIYLPISKRGDALKAAGIDTSKYFAIELPTGGSKMMRLDDNGVPVAVADDDPVLQAIRKQGTVPNRSLFRRWVMSQVFHGLASRWGFTEWMKNHGYEYQWDMLVEELRVQSKLFGKDAENFKARNRWFNKELAVTMAEDYMEKLKDYVATIKHHHCKGVLYVKIGCQDIFVDDLWKKLYAPLYERIVDIRKARTPQALYTIVKRFDKERVHTSYVTTFDQCREWQDAYKGMGAYATMQNLLRFHGCTFPKDNMFYSRRLSDQQMLEDAANSYAGGEGWRLFGLMKQMIEENGIDIKGKMEQWRRAKCRK